MANGNGDEAVKARPTRLRECARSGARQVWNWHLKVFEPDTGSHRCASGTEEEM